MSGATGFLKQPHSSSAQSTNRCIVPNRSRIKQQPAALRQPLWFVTVIVISVCWCVHKNSTPQCSCMVCIGRGLNLVVCCSLLVCSSIICTARSRIEKSMFRRIIILIGQLYRTLKYKYLDKDLNRNSIATALYRVDTSTSA